MRILCVLLPHFPLMCEIWRRPDIRDVPAVVLQSKDAAGSPKLVLDYSPGLDGLERDMPLQQALARHGGVELLHADMPRYRVIFNGILDALEERSPLVEGADLGWAYLGLDGMQLIYPDDDVLVKAVREAIPGVFTVQMGIAGGKFPAYLAARRSPPGGCEILTGDIAPYLRDLPCDVLPVSLKSRGKLRGFGIHTLGQLAALPPGPLQAQFGPEGQRLGELARGEDATPLYPRLTEEAIEESAALASVTVALEAILVAVEGMLVRVFTRTGRAGLGIRSLTLWTRTWDAESWERDIQFKEPAMDLPAAIRRVKRVLEDYPQPGPVEQVGIKINRLGYPRGRQKSLFADIRAQDHLFEDIRQLEFRLGNPQVYKVKEVEPWSRIPERRYALMPTNR